MSPAFTKYHVIMDARQQNKAKERKKERKVRERVEESSGRGRTEEVKR